MPPVCLEPWLQVADAAEPLKRSRSRRSAWVSLPCWFFLLTIDLRRPASENSHKWLAQGPGRPPAHCHQPQELEGPLGARGHGARAPGGGSKLVIGHLPGTARTHPGRTLPWGWTGTCSSCRPAQIAMTACPWSAAECKWEPRTWNWETHWTRRYFKELVDKLDCLFLFGSSAANVHRVSGHWTRRWGKALIEVGCNKY